MSTIYDALMKAESDRLKRFEGQGHEDESLVRVDDSLMPAEMDTHVTPEVCEKLYPLYQSLVNATSKQGLVLTFVGASAHDGVSTLTREFAKLASIELGHRVLLLDGNHGKGRHAEHLGVELFADCAAVAAGRKELSDALVPVVQDELSFGAISLNGTFTARIAARPEFGDLFKTMREKFELILIDAPPVSNSSEALAFTKVSDGAVLILQAEATRWQVAKQAKDIIENAGGKVLGAILNKKQHHIPDFIYNLL